MDKIQKGPAFLDRSLLFFRYIYTRQKSIAINDLLQSTKNLWGSDGGDAGDVFADDVEFEVDNCTNFDLTEVSVL